MLGTKDKQEVLFETISLRKLIPGDHILARVNKVLDLSWLREEVKDCYCEDNGRPSIDPEAAVRLMLAGFFHRITHDRALMREAQVNLAIRWFAGYKLDETLPDHSSLTRIRQRWGRERFKKIFKKTVECCVKAGLVDGKTVHLDATLIRADVSWESLTEDWTQAVIAQNAQENPKEQKDPDSDKASPPNPGGCGGKSGKPKKRSTTDPDATLTTSRKDFRMEPSYKQHTAVDDKAGVILDVHVTTGETNEGNEMPSAIERVEETTGVQIEAITADGAYAHAVNYQILEDLKIDAIIPPQNKGKDRGNVSSARFKYDPRNKTARCPKGKTLHRSSRGRNGWLYRATSQDCKNCPLRPRCVPSTAKVRTVLIVDGYDALLRARRRRMRWGDFERNLYSRHRWRVEGAHAEAKNRHSLGRAVRRGLANVAIQAYLAAAAMNLKRLAALFYRFFILLIRRIGNFQCQRRYSPAAS
jgi:transposase